MKIINKLSIFLIPTLISAQSKVTLKQIAAPSGISGPQVVIVDSTGVHAATVVGFTLVKNSDGTYTLTAGTVARESNNEIPTIKPDGSFTVANPPLSGTLKCYRNGLYQTPLVDYTVVGPVISSNYWNPDDILVCNYKW